MEVWCALLFDSVMPPSNTEKAVTYMESADQMGDLQETAEPLGMTCQSLCHYVNAINSTPRNIGKDGKFQLLVSLGARSVSEGWRRTPYGFCPKKNLLYTTFPLTVFSAETACCPSGYPCWWSAQWSWGCMKTWPCSETAPLSTPSSVSWRHCMTSPSHWKPRWSKASTCSPRSSSHLLSAQWGMEETIFRNQSNKLHRLLWDFGLLHAWMQYFFLNCGSERLFLIRAWAENLIFNSLSTKPNYFTSLCTVFWRKKTDSRLTSYLPGRPYKLSTYENHQY